MKLIVISPSGSIEKEHQLVTQLFEHGLETLHLRKPRMRTSEMRDYLEALPPHFHDRIVLHSHHRLSASFPVRGIHLTRVHRKRRFTTWLRLRWLRMRRPNVTVSTSYNKLANLYEDEKQYDYVFLSPIFDSLTGKFHSGYSEHSLRVAMQKNDVRVVARGGVNADCLERVNDLNFYGMALHSALWKAEDPLKEFVKVLERCRELGIKLE